MCPFKRCLDRETGLIGGVWPYVRDWRGCGLLDGASLGVWHSVSDWKRVCPFKRCLVRETGLIGGVCPYVRDCRMCVLFTVPC